jgi:hypothetical protein
MPFVCHLLNLFKLILRQTYSSLGATVHDEPWPLLQLLLQLLEVSQQLKLFTGWGCQPPTWRARVSLFVWIITFDLSSMGDPTNSCATAGITLRIICPRKPHHYVKVGMPTGGTNLLCNVYFLCLNSYQHEMKVN